ncbi:MAG: hypothetical protein N2511_06625 [Thermodesulfovibrionales bacterium]|nr:hypothetical protein [Thermodesulfovibrionales bacterium]
MKEEPLCIQIEVSDDTFKLFSGILQRGFHFKTKNIGNNLYAFLKSELELDDEYIEKRIKIVFLDGKPIDNLYLVTIKESSTIALSAAMPGLAGAILRQNSPFYFMREGISYKDISFCKSKTGYILLKLFNQIIDDIGRNILKKGVVLDKLTFMKLLKDLDQQKGLMNILVNGQEKKSEEFLKKAESFLQNNFHLSVIFK